MRLQPRVQHSIADDTAALLQQCTWECDEQSTPELAILGECGVAPTLVPGIPTTVCGAPPTGQTHAATGSPFSMGHADAKHPTKAPVIDPWAKVYAKPAKEPTDPFADDPLFAPPPPPPPAPPSAPVIALRPGASAPSVPSPLAPASPAPPPSAPAHSDPFAGLPGAPKAPAHSDPFAGLPGARKAP